MLTLQESARVRACGLHKCPRWHTGWRISCRFICFEQFIMLLSSMDLRQLETWCQFKKKKFIENVLPVQKGIAVHRGEWSILQPTWILGHRERDGDASVQPWGTLDPHFSLIGKMLYIGPCMLGGASLKRDWEIECSPESSWYLICVRGRCVCPVNSRLSQKRLVTHWAR